MLQSQRAPSHSPGDRVNRYPPRSFQLAFTDIEIDITHFLPSSFQLGGMRLSTLRKMISHALHQLFALVRGQRFLLRILACRFATRVAA